MNYIANVNAIKSLNAVPHFIDSENSSLGIDIKKLKSYLKKILEKKNKTINTKTGNTVSCLIVTHIFAEFLVI